MSLDDSPTARIARLCRGRPIPQDAIFRHETRQASLDLDLVADYLDAD